MKDSEKLQLISEVVNTYFDCDCGSAEAASAYMNNILTIIDFKGEENAE